MFRYVYYILVDGIGESPDSYAPLKKAREVAMEVAKRTGKAVVLKRWGGRRVVYIEIAKRAVNLPRGR